MADLMESQHDGIATLTLNRPDRLNALSEDMMRGLIEALSRLGADSSVGAIVLTGAGRAFCAGGDVKRMAGSPDPSFEARLERLRWMHQVPLAIRTSSKVVIAQLNGVAAGAGLSIALACDMRVAARSARFGTSFAGVGLSGDFGGSWTLTRLVGTAKARELYLLGDMIDGVEADRLGLLTRLVDDDRLLAETTALAARIVNGPRVAYRYMKRNLFAAETLPFADLLETEAMNMIRTQQTEDHREAAAAFVEKRKPAFKGQ